MQPALEHSTKQVTWIPLNTLVAKRSSQKSGDCARRFKALRSTHRTLTERDMAAQLQASRDALARSEARFITILETIESAFAIVKVKFDADDKPVDYYFVEANPAFEHQCGVNLRGKWVTEFAPNLESFWFETYGHVAKTGEPANFENYANTFERWFDVRAVRRRSGRPVIAILFNDVTQRVTPRSVCEPARRSWRENVERVQLAPAAGAIIGTWHWDLLTDRFAVDEAFARVFDLDPALGREGLSLEQVMVTVHPEDRDGLTSAINEAIGRGGAYPISTACVARTASTSGSRPTAGLSVPTMERRCAFPVY
jgi:PAS domain-containing protein